MMNPDRNMDEPVNLPDDPETAFKRLLGADDSDSESETPDEESEDS